MFYRWAIIGLIVLAGFSGSPGIIRKAQAEQVDKPWACKIISLQGRVMVHRQGQADWVPLSLNDTLYAGDRVQVEANSRAGIVLRNDAVLRLDQNTTLVFSQIEQETTFIFKLLKGAANFFSRRPRSLKIFTPFVNGVVEGTEFYVQVDAEQTRIDLFEGRIRAHNAYGEIQLTKGQGAVAAAGSAPQRRILVKDRESVQWALYYPPVLAFADDVPDRLKNSLAAFRQGRILEAVALINRVDEAARDSMYYTYRAGMLLQLGRVQRVRQDLKQALELAPDNSEAMALEAVMAVVQNRKKSAIQVAQKAVQSNPKSIVAQVALSYAHQAHFDLPDALSAVQAAVKMAPENSTVWARFAELQLSTGELDKGIEAGQKSVALDPRNAHGHTILGFAYLTKIKTKKAMATFEQAIALDSTAPLPRLGFGLAKIRRGDLEQGRAEIEIAAGLDPVNALIRSYLGKAYFDENRNGLDRKQFEVAKQLDPNDPTPWFYDAVRKQSINRPVEALHDLQQSIRLNDNRAVYRSRLLLDEDKAARGVSLARIYDDIGFKQRALVESTKSLSIDPTNHSAHRFLSDTYVQMPQHRIAQISERLQAQLLQPVNVNPVQPQLSIKGLNTVSGISLGEAAFNEFTPLFERDQTQLTLAGIAGNNNTYGDEAAISGIAGAFSYSLGQFHYQTDGFREKNNIEHDIYNAFSQIALSNKINVQFEYRRRDTTQGDTRLFLQPGFVPNQSRDLLQDTWRAGMHLSPSYSSDVIASFIYSDRKEGLLEVNPNNQLDVIQDRDGYNAEMQYMAHKNRFNFIFGGGLYRTNTDQNLTFTVQSPPSISTENKNYDTDGENLYFYTNIKYPAHFVWTLGLSYETYEDTEVALDPDELNPKLGLQWDVTEKVRLRAAYIGNIKRLLAIAQTIEPTQIAGFNQFFDDFKGTHSQLFGFAMDATLSEGLYTGFAYTQRDLTEGTNREEERYSGYLHWALPSNWSFNAEYRLERDLYFFDLETTSIPLSVHYFSPQGLFCQLGATLVWQEQEAGTIAWSSARDDFVVVDAAVGFRLPKRRGMISVEIGNLFDEEFLYRDASFKTADLLNVVQPYLPEQTIMAKIVLNF